MSAINKTRVTISLDNISQVKVRNAQAQLLKETNSSVSFSEIMDTAAFTALNDPRVRKVVIEKIKAKKAKQGAAQ